MLNGWEEAVSIANRFHFENTLALHLIQQGLCLAPSTLTEETHQLIPRYHRVTRQPFIFVGFIDFVTFGVVHLYTLFPARFWLAIFVQNHLAYFVNQPTFAIAQFFGSCRPDDISVLCAVLIPVLHQRVIKSVFSRTTPCPQENRVVALCWQLSGHRALCRSERSHAIPPYPCPDSIFLLVFWTPQVLSGRTLALRYMPFSYCLSTPESGLCF